MKIFIIGNGGREHAFTWKLSQSPLVSQIFVAPGNAGTALEAKTSNVNIAVSDIKQLLLFAKQQQCVLTLVGPELPLSLGIVDQFQAHGLSCFGPTQQAAQLETSKVFAKQFMAQFNIPTAHYATFNDISGALAYLNQHPLPVVIKADGLAAGKGVVIAHDLATARATVHDMLSGQTFGSAGKSIVIEEMLTGVEASFIVITDGTTIVPCPTSQDHKTRDDGDTGPNTGGMGACSPAAIITPPLHERVMNDIIKPTLHGMQQLGIPYSGFLYAGLMVSPEGEPKVLEFNCRCGDPETQAILMRLQSDLLPVIAATPNGTLAHHTLEWDSNEAISIVLTANSYPQAGNQGAIISGLNQALPAHCKIFHSGTTLNEQGKVITNGGRIITVASKAATLESAQQAAYSIAKTIHWEGGVHYRTDIGYRCTHKDAT